MGVPGLLLAPVTGIAAAIVRKDLLLLRNDNHLPAEQLLPNQAEGSAAFVADHPVFRQGQYDFLHRKRLHHLVKRPLFLPGVRLDCEVCFRRLRRFMILYRLSLVEQAQLVFAQDIPPLLAGLPELRTLGIGEDLCHVLQLSLELFHLSSQRRVFFLQPGVFRLQKGDIRTVIIRVFRHANVTLFITFLLKLYHKSSEKYRKILRYSK